MDIDEHARVARQLDKLIATAPNTHTKMAFQLLAQAASGGVIKVETVAAPVDPELANRLAQLEQKVNSQDQERSEQIAEVRARSEKIAEDQARSAKIAEDRGRSEQIGKDATEFAAIRRDLEGLTARLAEVERQWGNGPDPSGQWVGPMGQALGRELGHLKDGMLQLADAIAAIRRDVEAHQAVISALGAEAAKRAKR